MTDRKPAAASAVAGISSRETKDGDVARRWVEMVLGAKCSRKEFEQELQAGLLLCALANKVYKALGVKHTVEPSIDRSTDAEATKRAYLDVYLDACVSMGVATEDCFEPDDLLQLRNMAKVYQNILALQAVAISLSNRRSIDERSSIGNWAKPDLSPMSERGIFDDDEDDDDDMDSPLTMDLVQQMSWQRLLQEYENQQLRKADEQGPSDPSVTDGIGKLSHDIWCTEERIRALLLRDDREFGFVPDEFHGKLWMLASGAELEMRRNQGQFERLLAMETESTEATRQIDVDLNRTVSKADKAEWSEKHTQSLRRVLIAYAFYNPTLGYCQGLNYIVARILMFLEEEQAFYLLIKMIRLVPDDYYTTMLGLAVDQHVFADLVRLQMPDVVDKLSELGGSGMELSLACTEWFLTLFASPCVKEVTVQIWDSIFLFGDEVLFRVALALMQEEKSTLLQCSNFGDMLNHLNMLGRENVSPITLMKESRKQDCVIRARVEDFRAHHRLQLASGIAASSVEAEDTQTLSTGRPSYENKNDAKARFFGGKKKQSIFKHLDRNANRAFRTFERHLTEEHSMNLQRDHPNISRFYDEPPVVMENYWGSEESYSQWRTMNVICIPPDPKESNESERRRMQSDATFGQADTSSGREQNRQWRSKSTAYIQQKKSPVAIIANQPPHAGLFHKSGEEESPVVSRSPMGWMKRLEGWHKDMKIQKEKKKAEKLKQKLGRRPETMYTKGVGPAAGAAREFTTASTGSNRSRNGSSSSPRSKHRSSQQYRGRSFDRKKRTVSGRKSSGTSSQPQQHPQSEELEQQLSRSLSDPFRSPRDTMGWTDPSRASLHQEIDSQILIRSQDTGTQEFAERSAAKSTIEEHSNEGWQVDRRQATGGEAIDRTRRRSQLSSSHLFAGAVPVSPMHVHVRSGSTDFLSGGDSDDTHGPLNIRRNQSVPVREPQRIRSIVRGTTVDNAQMIRERAAVVSYLQRKASDLSSVAGSQARSSPRELYGGRVSVSSSESSEHVLLSNRSAATSVGFRKGSFSFFDQLTVDVESSRDNLNQSFLEEILTADDEIPEVDLVDWGPKTRSSFQK